MSSNSPIAASHVQYVIIAPAPDYIMLNQRVCLLDPMRYILTLYKWTRFGGSGILLDMIGSLLRFILFQKQNLPKYTLGIPGLKNIVVQPFPWSRPLGTVPYRTRETSLCDTKKSGDKNCRP